MKKTCLLLSFFLLAIWAGIVLGQPRVPIQQPDGWYMPTKDPLAVKDYGVDWSPWLASGDTVIASTWTGDPGITIEATSFSTTVTILWLAGGADYQKYQFTNIIKTLGGRTEVQRFKIIVKSQ